MFASGFSSIKIFRDTHNFKLTGVDVSFGLIGEVKTQDATTERDHAALKL